ncbi:MAG: SemiSWEET family transporter [Kofleriaceae bacterium]
MSAVAVGIGIAAAAASVTSFVPQVVRIVKTRETKDLSTPMWIFNSIGFALWIAYGIALGAWPVIVPNSICFVLAVFILVMILVPRRARDAIADTVTPSSS